MNFFNTFYLKYKAGHARNFLYPKGDVVYASDENIVRFAEALNSAAHP